MVALSRGELLRKLVHMAVGLIAFALPFLGAGKAALVALVAVLANLFLLPKLGGKALWRAEESKRGMSLGIVLYPFAVLILILLFWRHLEIAAAIWGILAFGDGMASLVGMTLGRAKLPWNPYKSWAGSLAYWLFGSLASSLLYLWTLRHLGGEADLPFILVICAITSLFAAWIESQPQGIDDNISVPILSGALLFGLAASHGQWAAFLTDGLLLRLLIGAAINLLLSLLAFKARSINFAGALMGFLLGTTIYAFLDWPGFVHLAAFFVLGTGTTKIGYEKKAKQQLAQEGGGRRSARHAVANAGVGALLAIFAAITPYSAICLAAFVAAFATAAGDTVSSELGQLWGRRTFMITTLRPVPKGTEGAVSVEGTLAGLAGSALVAFLGYLVGFYGLFGVLLVTLAAFVGTTMESLVGATLEKSGLLDNEAVNFLNTLIGAATAGALFLAFG
jgi:uncharacterized protein (TIGR00297 family)